MVDFSMLEAQIKANVDVEASAAALIVGLHTALDGLKADAAQIQAFLDGLKGSADKLAAAVVAGTPADPAPVPVPVPAPVADPAPVPTPDVPTP